MKEILNDNGITRFNSIGEINIFINNYESEKKEIPKIIENSLDEEINNLQSVLIKRQQIHDDLNAELLNELNHKIKKLEDTSKQAIEKSNDLDTIVAEPKTQYDKDHNIYKFVNQIEIVGTQKRIPDGIIYINGLPVVVFEFKSSSMKIT